MARWWLVLAVAGCKGGKDEAPPPPDDTDDPTTPSTTGDTGTEPVSPDLVVGPDNLYSVTVDWTIESAEIRAGYDVLLSWSSLATDAWGLPIDEAAIPVLAVIEVLYPTDEVPEHLAADDFGNDLLSVWEADVTGDVFANLSDLAYQDTPFDPAAFLLPEPGKTWLAALAFRDGPRLDLRTMIALRSVEGSQGTSVDLTDGSASVSWSGALDGAPLATSAGQALYTVDWEALETDALGKPYDPYAGDELFVGRFDDQAPADLAGDLDDLRSVASAWYTMDVARETDARLDLARDEANAPFGGFSAGATWVLGVRCTTCLSPFPLWATVVNVE